MNEVLLIKIVNTFLKQIFYLQITISYILIIFLQLFTMFYY